MLCRAGQTQGITEKADARITPSRSKNASCPVDLDHTLDGLATNGAEVDLLGAGYAGADVPTVAEDSILLF